MSTQLSYASLSKTWDGLIHSAASGTDGFHLRKMEAFGGPYQIHIRSLKTRIPLSAAGFQSRRWVRYIDDYLEGGPSFVEYLQDWTEAQGISPYYFNGSHTHTKGACITSVELYPETIVLNSRACDICPTGILDLTLLWWISYVTGIRKAIWNVGRIKFTVWQGVARKDILEVLRGTPMQNEVREYLKTHDDLSRVSFAMGRSTLRRRSFTGSLDELDVITNPIRINPNDLQLIFGVKRTKIQGYLGEKYGWTAQGSGNRSYSWTSYEDPIFQDVLRRFKLDPKKLPPIKEVAEQRSHRHSD